MAVLAVCKLLGLNPFSWRDRNVIKAPPPRQLSAIKNDYVVQLQRLSADYANNQTTKREAYQRLSFIIRSFVHDATGIDVTTLTRSEIRAYRIPKLDRLMDEYYIPEFAESERSVDMDFMNSCNNSLQAVKSWR